MYAVQDEPRTYDIGTRNCTTTVCKIANFTDVQKFTIPIGPEVGTETPTPRYLGIFLKRDAKPGSILYEKK